MTSQCDLQGEVDQLRRALDTRPTIDLAKGVVMALRRCSEEAAFRELAQVSRDTNIRLADLAEQLVVLTGQDATRTDLRSLHTTTATAARHSPHDVAVLAWARSLGEGVSQQRLWAREPAPRA